MLENIFVFRKYTTHPQAVQRWWRIVSTTYSHLAQGGKLNFISNFSLSLSFKNVLKCAYGIRSAKEVEWFIFIYSFSALNHPSIFYFMTYGIRLSHISVWLSSSLLGYSNNGHKREPAHLEEEEGTTVSYVLPVIVLSASLLLAVPLSVTAAPPFHFGKSRYFIFVIESPILDKYTPRNYSTNLSLSPQKSEFYFCRDIHHSFPKYRLASFVPHSPWDGSCLL